MSDRVSGVPTLETRMDDVRAPSRAPDRRARLLGVLELPPIVLAVEVSE